MLQCKAAGKPALDPGRIFILKQPRDIYAAFCVSNFMQEFEPQLFLHLNSIYPISNKPTTVSRATPAPYQSYSAQQRLFSTSLPFTMRCLRPAIHTNSGLMGLLIAWQPTEFGVSIEIGAHVASRLGFWASSFGHTGKGSVKS